MEQEIKEIENKIFLIKNNPNRKYLKRFEKKKLKNLNRQRNKLIKKRENEIKKNEKIENIFRRSIKSFNSKEESNNTITEKEVIEDMMNFGDIVKEKLDIEKKTNPEKFIETKEAIKNENSEFYGMGILANALESSGLTVGIKKESDGNKKQNATNLQYLVNGMATKKKLDIHIDFDKEKNEKILNDKIEQEKFINDWKQKLSEKLGVPISDIIITNLRKGSVNFDIFIQNHDNNFQKLTDNIKEVAKLNNANVTNVKVKNLMQAATITPDMFDKKGNRSSGWGVNEKRGGHPYIPPIGWVGHGLKVWDVYDGGDNTWLDYHGKKGEWAVAYHGTNLQFAGSIMKTGLAPGQRQAYADDDDVNHPGQKVGDGVYVTPDISIADGYSNSNNGIKCVFMCRVNPKEIRYSKNKPKYWVVNGTPNDIRPYRLLCKKG